MNSLNPHFGTAEDLKDLVTAIHKRGMYLMVDIVVNQFVDLHFTEILPGSKALFSQLR